MTPSVFPLPTQALGGRQLLDGLARVSVSSCAGCVEDHFAFSGLVLVSGAALALFCPCDCHQRTP